MDTNQQHKVLNQVAESLGECVGLDFDEHGDIVKILAGLHGAVSCLAAAVIAIQQHIEEG